MSDKTRDSAIAMAFKNGKTVGELSEMYGLTNLDVQDAIRLEMNRCKSNKTGERQ